MNSKPVFEPSILIGRPDSQTSEDTDRWPEVNMSALGGDAEIWTMCSGSSQCSRGRQSFAAAWLEFAIVKDLEAGTRAVRWRCNDTT
jgi:hypothetical protein